MWVENTRPCPYRNRSSTEQDRTTKSPSTHMTLDHPSIPSIDVAATAFFFERQRVARSHCSATAGPRNVCSDIDMEEATDDPVAWPHHFRPGLERTTTEACRTPIVVSTKDARR